MSLRITKLHDNVTKVDVGQWILTSTGDTGFAVHKDTAEFFNYERIQIDDLIEGLKAVKTEMIREHHG
jgi:hypothetical protein